MPATTPGTHTAPEYTHYGSIIRAAGVEWTGPRPYVDVRSKGAVGDGVANDAQAFTNAIAAAAVAGGGLVYVPGGTYLLGSAISLTAGVELIGEGVNRTILRVTGSHDGLNPLSDTRIAHLTLRGPNSAQSGQGGVDSGSASNVVIEHCVIEQWGAHGINTGGTSDSWWIHHCLIQNNIDDGILVGAASSRCVISDNIVQSNGANGVDLNGSYNIVEGNIVRLNGTTPASAGVDQWGIVIAGLGTANANYNIIRGNILIANESIGIILKCDSVSRTANYNLIAENYVEGGGASPETNQDGITLDGSTAGTMEGTVIIGNIVRAMNRNGIMLTDTVGTITRTVVIGNSATGCTGTGLRIDAVDTSLIGNLALGNTAAQVDVTGATRTMDALNKVSTANAAAIIENTVLGAGGTTIVRHYSGAATLNFGAPGAVPGSVDLTITVTGVAFGDTVAVASPVTVGANYLLTAFVSAADTITIRWTQIAGAAADPDGAGGTYRVDAWRH